jgi:hypothetical protein
LELLLLFKKALLYFYTLIVLVPNIGAPKSAELSVCIAAAEIKFRFKITELIAVIYKESKWNEGSVGATNDWGLGQIHCPSKYCDKRPSTVQRAKLLSGCDNLFMVAEFLQDRGITSYNPASDMHLTRVQRLQRKISRIWSNLGYRSQEIDKASASNGSM